MLYYLSQYLVPYWGPFRLLQSHALLLAGGTFAAALLVWLLLPRVWDRLPQDHGKAILKDMGGMQSRGKPTGTGLAHIAPRDTALRAARRLGPDGRVRHVRRDALRLS